MKNFLKNKIGITLIALVITIIVLLILAGVSIAMLTGNNGVLDKAAEAKNATQTGETEDTTKLNNYSDIIDSYTNGNGVIILENLEENGINISDGSITTDGSSQDENAKAIDYLKGTIVIPEGVTTIDEFAFYGCNNIIKIILPSTLKTIKRSAFMNCNSLQSIVIPDTVTTIGEYVFSECHTLTDVTLSRNVKTIESNTFEFCRNLNNIVIPSNVESIGATAFAGCTTKVSFECDETRAKEICNNTTDIITYLSDFGTVITTEFNV